MTLIPATAIDPPRGRLSAQASSGVASLTVTTAEMVDSGDGRHYFNIDLRYVRIGNWDLYIKPVGGGGQVNYRLRVSYETDNDGEVLDAPVNSRELLAAAGYTTEQLHRSADFSEKVTPIIGIGIELPGLNTTCTTVEILCLMSL